MRRKAQKINVVTYPAHLRLDLWVAFFKPLDHILEPSEVGLQTAQSRVLAPCAAFLVEIEGAAKFHPAPRGSQYVLLLINQIQVVGPLEGQELVLKMHCAGDAALGRNLRVNQVLQGSRSEGLTDLDSPGHLLAGLRQLLVLGILLLLILLLVVLVQLCGLPVTSKGGLAGGVDYLLLVGLSGAVDGLLFELELAGPKLLHFLLASLLVVGTGGPVC